MYHAKLSKFYVISRETSIFKKIIDDKLKIDSIFNVSEKGHMSTMLKVESIFDLVQESGVVLSKAFYDLSFKQNNICKASKNQKIYYVQCLPWQHSPSAQQ